MEREIEMGNGDGGAKIGHSMLLWYDPVRRDVHTSRDVRFMEVSASEGGEEHPVLGDPGESWAPETVPLEPVPLDGGSSSDEESSTPPPSPPAPPVVDAPESSADGERRGEIRPPPRWASDTLRDSGIEGVPEEWGPQDGPRQSRRHQAHSTELVCSNYALLSCLFQDRVPNAPIVVHWQDAQQILRFLRGTPDLGIFYPTGTGDSDLVLSGWCDSDWAGDVDHRRSTTGYCFTLGAGAISWSSKKQPTIALSSFEA